MKTPLTFEEHAEFGKALKEMRLRLLDNRIWECGLKKSKEHQALVRACHELDRLRSAMDDAAVRDFPNREGVLSLYYGAETPQKI